MKFMTELGEIHNPKDSVKPPERHLGAVHQEDRHPSCCTGLRDIWSMNGKEHIKNAVSLAKDMLASEEWSTELW